MRKSYLDNIRWITVILVVLYHVFYMYNAEGVHGGLGQITDLRVQYFDLYQYIVYPWFMPILFIVSGICSRFDLERHDDKSFLSRRTTKLLVPSTIGLIAFQFIQGYINMSIGGAFESFENVPTIVIVLLMVISGIGVLWYIQMLWVFSLALVWIRKIEKDRLWSIGSKVNMATLLIMTPLVWMSAQFMNTPVIVVYRFGFYGLAFLLGYFVFSHEEVIDCLRKWFIPLLATACVLGAVFCSVYFGKNFADTPINRSPLFTSFSWFACLAILGGMARYGDFENKYTRWLQKKSFGLYVFHYLGISAVAHFIGKNGLLPAPMIYLLSLFAGFAAGYGLNAVISRIPFFRWAVLGIKQKG